MFCVFTIKMYNNTDDKLDEILRKYGGGDAPSISASSSRVVKEIVHLSSDDESLPANFSQTSGKSTTAQSDEEQYIPIAPKFSFTSKASKETVSSSDDEISFSANNSQSSNAAKWSDDERYLSIAEKFNFTTAASTECIGSGSSSSKENIYTDENVESIDAFLARIQKSKSPTSKAKQSRKRKGSNPDLQTVIPPKLKKIKPEEYVKYIKVEIDKSLESTDFFANMIHGIDELGACYKVKENSIENSIMWKRANQEYTKSQDGTIFRSIVEENEEDAILIVTGDFVVESILNDTFVAFATNINITAERRITLVIYKINDYLNAKQKRKGKKQSDVRKVTRNDLENALCELQVLLNWNSRLIDTPAELEMMVANYTKAIAQIPYKLEKQERDNQMDKYLQGDNKNCVQVDKNGNGLQRLWKQQLMSFPLSSLETAEAICMQYSSFKALAEAYKGEIGDELLLQNIPIRRGAGPFSNARKLGPELSKKVHCYITSTDPKELL